MTLGAAADWANVLVAFIVGLPGLISAIYAVRVHRKVKTPSGKTIGRQVEDVLHTTISSNHYAAAISDKVGAHPSPHANGEARKVEGLTDNGGTDR